MQLNEYLNKHSIKIDCDTTVEYRLIDDSNYEEWKDSEGMWPGFTSEEVAIDSKYLRIRIDDDALNDVYVPLDKKGDDIEDGFMTEIDGEKVKLVFLH